MALIRVERVGFDKVLEAQEFVTGAPEAEAVSNGTILLHFRSEDGHPSLAIMLELGGAEGDVLRISSWLFSAVGVAGVAALAVSLFALVTARHLPRSGSRYEAVASSRRAAAKARSRGSWRRGEHGAWRD